MIRKGYLFGRSTIKPHKKILKSLAPAYAPCEAFKSPCTCMRWNPKAGHVPRGFCGAISRPDDVKLVLITAEPGDPHAEENHEDNRTVNGRINSATNYVWNCYAVNGGKDLFHRNIRDILNLCWPGLEGNFVEQMRRTWITDTVLCSAKVEGGYVPVSVAKECIKRYLLMQLSLFKEPFIVAALGVKAQRRIRRAKIEFLPAYSAAPPGCNFKGAKPSWEKIATALHKLP